MNGWMGAQNQSCNMDESVHPPYPNTLDNIKSNEIRNSILEESE